MKKLCTQTIQKHANAIQSFARTLDRHSTDSTAPLARRAAGGICIDVSSMGYRICEGGPSMRGLAAIYGFTALRFYSLDWGGGRRASGWVGGVFSWRWKRHCIVFVKLTLKN
jgi:hypothetical protein